MNSNLFPFADYWWFYLAFTGLIAVLLVIDLRFHRKEQAISLRKAGLWVSVWMALALVFSYALYLFASARLPADVARRVSLEFLAGYLVEESLSVDNMFVFVLVFRYFGIPPRYQHRVLFYGVLGAMIFRGIFIGIGSALVRFHAVMVLFGCFLILTGIRMAFEGEKQIDPGKSRLIRWLRRWFAVTPELHGGKFFARVNGVMHMTPLLMVLVFLEATDVVFAVDSVPAVFGVTKEPLIVFTSNVFAILGLRALYFVLAGAMDRFHALKHGLAIVLVFVGLKMVWLDHLFGGRFPIGISLGFIAVVIGGSMAVSLLFPKGSTRGWAPLSASFGVICLLLAAASVWSAVSDPALVEDGVLRDEWLYVSAVCYAIGGVVLLRGRTGKH